MFCNRFTLRLENRLINCKESLAINHHILCPFLETKTRIPEPYYKQDSNVLSPTTLTRIEINTHVFFFEITDCNFGVNKFRCQIRDVLLQSGFLDIKFINLKSINGSQKCKIQCSECYKHIEYKNYVVLTCPFILTFSSCFYNYNTCILNFKKKKTYSQFLAICPPGCDSPFATSYDFQITFS